ncbi:unnamed protein product [Cylindrotheca closterium]|uniref:HSF-type DNA-binding domain-containing protein n=1 Tax=Cylindrotheca closterium TaxID=2856 RepID=A0AAD2FEB4_9STRA|nr:unnamed protein product [Cylindrotheca closterium]
MTSSQVSLLLKKILRCSHNPQKPLGQTLMISLTIEPSLFSMNQANISSRHDEDNRSSASDVLQTFRQSSQHDGRILPPPISYVPNYHGALHMRASHAYKLIDNSDDLRAFPIKLHACLDDAESRGFHHIISWQKHSLFKIKDVDAFEQHIMPQYFRSQTKYKSFQRQLNLYEFERVPKGPFRGSYMHPFFKRGQHELSNRMRLRKIKGRNSVSFESPKIARTARKVAKPLEETKEEESTAKENPQAMPPPSKPQEAATRSQTQRVPDARRPRNRPRPQCTFEGRKFFPI